MGRADYKEMIPIKRLDEAGWLNVLSTGVSELSRHGGSSAALMKWKGL